jgi:hypothetical protein
MSAPRWFCNFQAYGAAILDFLLSFLLFMHNSSRPDQTSSWQPQVKKLIGKGTA